VTILALAAFLQLAAAPAQATANITYSKHQLRASFEVEKFKNGQKETPSYETWDVQCADKGPGTSCSLEQVVVMSGKRGCVFTHRRYSTNAGTLALKKLNMKEGVLEFSFGEPGAAADFDVHAAFLKNGPNETLLLKDFKATGSWPVIPGADAMIAWEYRLPEFLDEFKPDCRYILRKQ
jgi:hypothetical protein